MRTCKRRPSLGAGIKAKIAALDSPADLAGLELPGRFSYEGGAKAMVTSPITQEEVCVTVRHLRQRVSHRGHHRGRKRGDRGGKVHPLHRLREELSHRGPGLAKREAAPDGHLADA